MLIRKRMPAAFAVAVGLLACGPTAASATTTLRTDPGGILLSGSTTVRNTSSGPATITFATGNLVCTQTAIDADVTSNSSATSITGTLTALTFSSCNDSILHTTYSSCSLHPAGVPTVTITAGATGGSVTFGHLTVRCAMGSLGCYFTLASSAGTMNNAASSIAFSNVDVSQVTPTSDAITVPGCAGTGTLSLTLNHIVQGGTNKTLTVTTS